LNSSFPFHKIDVQVVYFTIRNLPLMTYRLWPAAADDHRHISVANNIGLRRMIAGSVADNLGLNNRQLHLIPAENCADCWFGFFDCKPLELGV
jgi:hypothetical protein